jgi:hypothetical protein
MAGPVVLDEWTIVLVADTSLSSPAAELLRALVDDELGATTARLTSLLPADAAVSVLPR